MKNLLRSIHDWWFDLFYTWFFTKQFKKDSKAIKPYFFCPIKFKIKFEVYKEDGKEEVYLHIPVIGKWACSTIEETHQEAYVSLGMVLVNVLHVWKHIVREKL